MLKKQAMNILKFNLKDNVNAYFMQENGDYTVKEQNGEQPFNIHKEFYKITQDTFRDVSLF
jgi:polyphosphate kinase